MIPFCKKGKLCSNLKSYGDQYRCCPYYHYCQNNSKLKQVENTKFLGLILDQHLRWDKHVDYVVYIKCNPVD